MERSTGQAFASVAALASVPTVPSLLTLLAPGASCTAGSTDADREPGGREPGGRELDMARRLPLRRCWPSAYFRGWLAGSGEARCAPEVGRARVRRLARGLTALRACPWFGLGVLAKARSRPP